MLHCCRRVIYKSCKNEESVAPAGPIMLLVLLQALLVASMRVERMRGPHATSTTRRALLANAETTTRRATLAIAAATLATTRRCDALQLEGEYADPNHVDGWRKIKVTGDRARITGQDDPGGPVWSIRGIATDSTIALLVEPCLLYTSPSPRDKRQSRMPSSA